MNKKKNKQYYNFGGTMGQILQTASPFLSMIPGVGTVGGMAAGLAGGLLQQASESPTNYQPMRSNQNPYGFNYGGVYPSGQDQLLSAAGFQVQYPGNRTDAKQYGGKYMDDNEVIQTDKRRVFSDEKILGMAGMSPAKLAKQHEKAKGKAQKYRQSVDPYSAEAKTTERLSEMILDRIFAGQEQTKAMMGIETGQKMKNGGNYIEAIVNKPNVQGKAKTKAKPADSEMSWWDAMSSVLPNISTLSGMTYGDSTIQGLEMAAAIAPVGTGVTRAAKAGRYGLGLLRAGKYGKQAGKEAAEQIFRQAGKPDAKDLFRAKPDAADLFNFRTGGKYYEPGGEYDPITLTPEELQQMLQQYALPDTTTTPPYPQGQIDPLTQKYIDQRGTQMLKNNMNRRPTPTAPGAYMEFTPTQHEDLLWMQNWNQNAQNRLQPLMDPGGYFGRSTEVDAITGADPRTQFATGAPNTRNAGAMMDPLGFFGTSRQPSGRFVSRYPEPLTTEATPEEQAAATGSKKGITGKGKSKTAASSNFVPDPAVEARAIEAQRMNDPLYTMGPMPTLALPGMSGVTSMSEPTLDLSTSATPSIAAGTEDVGPYLGDTPSRGGMLDQFSVGDYVQMGALGLQGLSVLGGPEQRMANLARTRQIDSTPIRDQLRRSYQSQLSQNRGLSYNANRAARQAAYSGYGNQLRQLETDVAGRNKQLAGATEQFNIGQKNMIADWNAQSRAANRNAKRGFIQSVGNFGQGLSAKETNQRGMDTMAAAFPDVSQFLLEELKKARANR